MNNEILGVILAGGVGSRLFPLTKVYNKCTLPVGNRPMIFYSIEKLVEAGITKIAIIVGSEHSGDIVEHVGSGREFGAEICYFCQDSADGIPSALALTKSFLRDNKFVLLLSDNIFMDSLNPHVEAFKDDKDCGEYIFLKKVPDPERFGVLQMEGDKIVDIVEKPKDPRSNYAIVGIYFLDSYFWDIFPKLQPSKRLETEITDVHRAYLAKGKLGIRHLKEFWADIGEVRAYREVNMWFGRQDGL